MNTASDPTQRIDGRKKVAIAALTFLTLGGFSTTCYLLSENSDMLAAVSQSKLVGERLLAEKLQLEKHIVELNGRLDGRNEELAESDRTVADLRKQVQEAIARAKGPESAARKNNDLLKEVKELRELQGRLVEQTILWESNVRDLQEQLTSVTGQRNELAASLEQQRTAAQMVNNAEVDALRGRKGRLTVVARRTREIRMAFDLPQALASAASFKIITPGGHSYAGADPSISMTVDEPEMEPTASVDLLPEAMLNERASRVHLKFKPTGKLEPGTYRIDVMVDGGYLSTVLLNLR